MRRSERQSYRRTHRRFPALIHLPADVCGQCIRLRQSLKRVLAESGANALRDYVAKMDLPQPETAEMLRDFQRVTSVRSLSNRHGPVYRDAHTLAEC
jgi:hypothetical protein